MKRVLIVGGGPGGLMAAAAASLLGAQVTLLERNGILGKKLALTGGGRCNLTNNTDIEGLIQNIPGNGKFLYSVLNQFDSQSLQQFVTDILGLRLREEEDGKVFLAELPASSLSTAFREFLQQHGASLLYNQRATKLLLSGGKAIGVTTATDKYHADAVIVCTGGCSYPSTGSTGDGYKLALEAGHTIMEPRAALVPLQVHEQWPKMLQGISLSNVTVALYKNNGSLAGQQSGDIIFTHYGVSGPAILQLSREIVPALLPYQLIVNQFPDLTRDELVRQLIERCAKQGRKTILSITAQLVPRKLAAQIINNTGIRSDKPGNQISKSEAEKLAEHLQELQMTITQTRPLSEAMVTAGGVNVNEVNPRTMESRLVKGLYFAGEVLDIDGFTGGYNLQAAFSTGYAAGAAAASRR